MSYQFIKTHLLEIILFTLFLIFSLWLMFGTFSYRNGAMIISGKAWSDFASHIPLIRSFSFGSNFLPQEPLFPGEPIHYHFLFYLFVGLLEKLGVRIDYALNIPSALGFFALLVILYIYGKKLFHSSAVGILTVIFFIFNGTLSFLEFFKQHPLGPSTIQTIITNNTFPSFGPYSNTIVSAFWNLNIYTNQRHLAAAYALALFLLYMTMFHSNHKPKRKNLTQHKEYEKKEGFFISQIHYYLQQCKDTNIVISLLIGTILGLSFFFHIAVFLMTVILVCCFFIFFKNIRISSIIILLGAAIIALPQYIYLKSGNGGFDIKIVPGYLVFDHLTFLSFITYWFYNLGLHSILIPIGFVLAPKNIKKIFIAFLVLFFVGNIFQFAPEMAENHKFFNFFLLFGSMLSAYTLVLMWRKSFYWRPFVVIAVFFLTLSGIIDFFPIYNDGHLTLADYPITPDIQWIMKHTEPNATILNTNYLYDSASIAGRKIFLGWPYFPWSEGFDTTSRSDQIKNFFAIKDKKRICQFLKRNNLDYVDLTTPSQDFPFDPQFWQSNFSSVYNNPQTHLTVYKTTLICQNY